MSMLSFLSNFMNKNKTKTLSNNTIASNPGGVNFLPWIYLRYYPISGLSLAALLISSLFLLTYSLHFLVFPVLIFSANSFYWSQKKEQFKFGDSNPGRVIHTNPTLIAVATNLTKYGKNFPVIKVIKSPINNLAIGDIIGTIAVYSAGKDESLPHWVDFDPIPIECATNNKEEIDAALRSYNIGQLEALDFGVSTLEKPYKKGLYKIHSANSDWVKE